MKKLEEKKKKLAEKLGVDNSRKIDKKSYLAKLGHTRKAEARRNGDARGTDMDVSKF